VIPVSVTATPSHLSLVGRAAAEVRVVNNGSSPVAVALGRAAFLLDARGRPRLGGDIGAATWLTVRPARLGVLAPHAAAVVSVAVAPPRGASPGDHRAVLLLTAQPPGGAAIAVRVRLGVTVVDRIPGAVVHRLAAVSLRVHGRAIALMVANRGNVDEWLHARVTLLRGGRVVATVSAPVRLLLPRTRATVGLPRPAHVHGRVRALVMIGPAQRSFPLRL
jgi:hypothetical protein